MLQACNIDGCHFPACLPMKSVLFGVNTQKLQELGVLHLKGVAEADALEGNRLSSEEHLFCRLWASNQLRGELFTKGDRLMRRGEQPEFAHILFKGQALVSTGDEEFLIGPGAVIGLAEGLTGAPALWDVRAASLLMTRIIPIDAALQAVDRADPGLRALCRVTARHVLDRGTPPASPREDKALGASAFPVQSWPAGAVLARPGGVPPAMYLVESGEVEVSGSGAPRRLRAGDVFGESAVFGGEPAETAVAATDLVCTALSAAQLQSVLRGQKSLTRPVIEAVMLQMYLHSAIRSAQVPV